MNSPSDTSKSKTWDLDRLSFWVILTLTLIICSKGYYLFGVDRGNKPIAPNAIILLRDVISFGFIFVFGWIARKKLAQQRFFWILFFTGVVISLIQLFVIKDSVTWAQHYVRNILIPLLTYPVLTGLSQMGVKLRVRPVFIWLFAVGIFLSYAQIYFSKDFIRPTGFFGDPIINSVFLLWGFIAVALSRGKIAILLASVLLIPLIQYLSSLSALLSVILGALTVFLISKNEWLEYCRLHMKKVILSVLGGIVLVSFLAWVTQNTHQKNIDEGASEKAQALLNSIFCKQEGCEHWSYKGRIESNLRPFRLCKESASDCLFGNIHSTAYERVESTWGSLVANWGIIFCGLYIFWVFSHLLKSRKIPIHLTTSDPDLIFWQLVFYSGLFFCIFNTVPYKFPVNVIWYASLALIHARLDHMEKS